jgi:hypothetical protein
MVDERVLLSELAQRVGDVRPRGGVARNDDRFKRRRRELELNTGSFYGPDCVADASRFKPHSFATAPAETEGR